MIDAVCVVDTLTDVFEQFAAAVLEQLTGATEPAAALDAVLGTWRRFLHATAATLPGRERLAGLAEHGVTEVVFQPCGADVRRELEVFIDTAKSAVAA